MRCDTLSRTCYATLQHRATKGACHPDMIAQIPETQPNQQKTSRGFETSGRSWSDKAIPIDGALILPDPFVPSTRRVLHGQFLSGIPHLHGLLKH